MTDRGPIDAAIDRLKQVYTPDAGRPSEDAQPDLSMDADHDDDNVVGDLAWPPPGLEHIHGLLPRINTQLTLAAVLMLAPVLVGSVRDRPITFGSWGTALVWLIVGVLLFAAYMLVLVLFNRATAAVRAGFPRQLVWQVATDSWRNTPAVLRGTGAYERLDITRRTAMLDARVTASQFAFGAALWLTAATPLWLLAAFAGSLRGDVALLGTLVPAALLAAASIFFRWRELRTFYGNRIPDEEERHRSLQARGWRSFFRRAGYHAPDLDMGNRYRLLGSAAVFSIFLMLPLIGFALFTMAVPLLVQPPASLYPMAVRRAALEPLRVYAPAADTTISPQYAGAVYHGLIMGDLDPRSQVLKRATIVLPDDSAFHVLARAGAMDFAAARWHMGADDVPPPWRSEPTRHRLRAAAAGFARHTNEAGLRAIIAAGFLVADNALTMWDAQQGQVVVQIGATELARYYRRTGRVEDAGTIDGLLIAAANAAGAALTLSRGTDETAGSMQRMVLRGEAPRAVRWEVFTTLATLAHCGSVPAVIFGPGGRHDLFVDRARDVLVRYPADVQYFEIAQRGFTSRVDRSTPGCNFDWLGDLIRGR